MNLCCYLKYRHVLYSRVEVAYSGVSLICERHADDFQIVRARTQTFKNSFIISGSKLWNDLPPKNRNFEYAKEMLKGKSNDLYNFGPRDLNFRHAQLRMNCSKLNSHLFSLHVLDSPECTWGFNFEDSKHYLLHCPLNVNARQNITPLSNINNLNIDEAVLLFGSADLVKYDNLIIFQAVQILIKNTNHFKLTITSCVMYNTYYWFHHVMDECVNELHRASCMSSISMCIACACPLHCIMCRQMHFHALCIGLCMSMCIA